jgi:hypothetical protein
MSLRHSWSHHVTCHQCFRPVLSRESTSFRTMSSNEDQQQAQPRIRKNFLNEDRPESLIRRSWHAMSEVFSPFSSTALGTLPNVARPQRYTRADAIPEIEGDDEGHQPTVRDYHSISTVPSQIRVPKKIATPIKVEGKVWFANERSASPSCCVNPVLTSMK